jgi:hypothetical protein
MALTPAPTVVNQVFSVWANLANPLTYCGTIQSDYSRQTSVGQGGIAQIWYDPVLNQICVDTLS